MNNKLFVGNLNYSTAEADLRQAFEPFGALRSVAIISDRMTGQPRGFGFVEYDTAGDAQKAIDSLDGREVDGRNIVVSVARDRAPAPRFGGGDGGGGGGERSFGGGGGGGGGDSGGAPRRGGAGKGGRGANRW